jgi:DNA-binding transcriptional LysR family regulator
MHVDPADPLHALAVAGPPDAVTSLVELLDLAEPWARTASLNHSHAILTRSLPPELPDALAGQLRIGVGPALPALQAPDSWQEARIALRFAKLGHLYPTVVRADTYPTVVRADTLGALSVISTTMRPADIARVADVAALDRIAAAPHGIDTLTALTALCAAGSVRQAATRLYRHHSTLAARIALAEARLGFCPTTPAGRSRLELAILLRHLRDTPE